MPNSSFSRSTLGAGCLALGCLLLVATGCSTSQANRATLSAQPARPPTPDPRIGLKPGLFDAGEAVWNLRVVSRTPPPRDFVGITHSDLAFMANYVIQGNYHGFLIWDVSDPANPSLVTGYICPASQNDVSVYRNLLFVSAEAFNGRLDCGTQGVREVVSKERIRGIRIFDLSDIRNPKYVGNVQTCRGSHTHSVLVDPKDPENVYIYVSGSAPVRSPEELPGCSRLPLSEDPNTALFRIEVIRVPLAHPEQAAIVSSPRIFSGLVAPPRHGLAPEDIRELEEARARGAFIVDIEGQPMRVPDQLVRAMLDSLVRARNESGPPTGADSATLRQILQSTFQQMMRERVGDGPRPGPNQCHDITLYPAIGLAGGACEGYGLLIDITNPVDPRRIDAAADSNFAYWHSATFNNDGTKILFTDEWGGGGQPKCRATDPKEWGGNAIFTIENRRLRFRSYYKLPAPQTRLENCVAHNGSLIPIPGRDIMVQGWYQGGVSVFDWTDPDRPFEIAFFDRGPVDSTRMQMAGSWSAYWYNGFIYSSEIARGLDVLELVPSPYLTENEIAAAKTARLDYLNVQGQPRYEWPATFVLARAYLDQLERSRGLSPDRLAAARRTLAEAERASGDRKSQLLSGLAADLDREAGRSTDAGKVRLLLGVIRELASGS